MSTATQWYTDIAKQYPLVSGREIYGEASITGLNRLPISTLVGYITSGINENVDLNALAGAVLIEGSVMFVSGQRVEGIIEAGPSHIVQQIADSQIMGGYIARVYAQLTDNTWEVVEYRNYNTQMQAKIRDYSLSADDVIYWYNSYAPTGILYPAQYTYRRLEEIASTIRVWQSGPGAKTIVYGLAMNAPQTEAKLMSTSPAAFLPGDLNVDRLANTAAIDQLITEMERLQPLYYQQVHIVDTTSPVQRPSGADRSLVLGPMMRFIDTAREWISQVLTLLGTAWTYDRIHTSDVNERTAELALLQQMLTLGVIDQTTFKAKAVRLT